MQQRAQELRQEFLALKASKLKYHSEKVQAVQERKNHIAEQRKSLKEQIDVKLEKAEKNRDQLRQSAVKKPKIRKKQELKANERVLKEQIEEKLEKANKLRKQHLLSIKSKANIEESRREELLFALTQRYSNFLSSTQEKKAEVIRKTAETEARVQDLSGQRIKKALDVAIMQDAAMERRKQQELKRLCKLEQLEMKKKLLAEKQQQIKESQAARAAQQQERIRRVQESHSARQLEEEEHRRELSEKLSEKLEQGTQRKNEQIQQVKEKAAAANQNDKIVADRVIASRLETATPVEQVVFELDLAHCRKNSKKTRARIRHELAANPVHVYSVWEPSQKFQSLVESMQRRLEVFKSAPVEAIAMQADCGRLKALLPKAGADRTSHLCFLYQSGILTNIAKKISLERQDMMNLKYRKY